MVRENETTIRMFQHILIMSWIMHNWICFRTTCSTVIMQIDYKSVLVFLLFNVLEDERIPQTTIILVYGVRMYCYIFKKCQSIWTRQNVLVDLNVHRSYTPMDGAHNDVRRQKLILMSINHKRKDNDINVHSILLQKFIPF